VIERSYLETYEASSTCLRNLAAGAAARKRIENQLILISCRQYNSIGYFFRKYCDMRCLVITSERYAVNLPDVARVASEEIVTRVVEFGCLPQRENVKLWLRHALTSSIFALQRDAIVKAMNTLRYAAGNFYVNDKPTGAVVGQQPFGGSRASGTNDKAGSWLNLERWVSPRTIKETFLPPRDFRYPYMQGK
jgi:hypothetical protein